MSSSTYSLSRDENGQQFRSLQAAASDRRQNLNIIFSMFDMVYPYLAVDQDVSQLPLIFSNPFKLHALPHTFETALTIGETDHSGLITSVN
jgi:hypothetical protein